MNIGFRHSLLASYGQAMENFYFVEGAFSRCAAAHNVSYDHIVIASSFYMGGDSRLATTHSGSYAQSISK